MEVSWRLGTERGFPKLFEIFERAARQSGKSLSLWQLAYDEKGLLHADYWAQQSQLQYPAGSVMTPFIGSHDSPRFVTLATYRGQPGYDKGVPGNQWSNVAGAPPDAEPYARHALALSWLMGLPGAPLLYYGDEYGEWGGSDPGNRAFWRGDATLSANESGRTSKAR